jgi:hypothetical protein
VYGHPAIQLGFKSTLRPVYANVDFPSWIPASHHYIKGGDVLPGPKYLVPQCTQRVMELWRDSLKVAVLGWPMRTRFLVVTGLHGGNARRSTLECKRRMTESLTSIETLSGGGVGEQGAWRDLVGTPLFFCEEQCVHVAESLFICAFCELLCDGQ